jgi:Zn-dependent protease with chaperone function
LLKLPFILLVLLAGAAPPESPGRPAARVERVAVPEPTPRAVEFHRTGLWLWGVGRVWSLLVPTLIVATGLSARIQKLARRWSRWWIGEIWIYLAIFLGLMFLIHLPWRFYMGYVRQHAYGLSVQGPGAWLGDGLKGLLVELVGGCLFAWVPYRLMRVSPRRWWLYTGVLLLPFSAFSVYVTPIWVDPLFHHFGPMHDRALEARIATLARRAGIDDGKIFEVDQSKETTTVNAYVTGLLGTKRIVLWDTLLARLEPDEVLAVMGHEMGHYALDHVSRGLLAGSAGMLLGLFIIHRLGNALIARFHRRFGFDRLGDVASAPLILVLLYAQMFIAAPVVNAFGREMEHEADRFALEVTHDNHAAASAFLKLQASNLSIPYPDPFSRIWRSTHPSIGERIEFANDYRPWETGQPSRYEALIQPR